MDSPSQSQDPEVLEYGPESLASVAERFWAFALDFFIWAGVCALSLICLSFLIKTSLSSGDALLLGYAFIAFSAGLWLLYHGVGNARGGTPGKRILGIRAVSARGGVLNYPRSFLRAAGYALSGTFLSLGYLWCFLNAGRRAWHDYLAGTRVIRTREKSKGALLLLSILGYPLMALCVVSPVALAWMTPRIESAAQTAAARLALEEIGRMEELFYGERGAFALNMPELLESRPEFSSNRAWLEAAVDFSAVRLEPVPGADPEAPPTALRIGLAARGAGRTPFEKVITPKTAVSQAAQ